jgi:2-polyprenyl-3-methyl-5-hydroxy-6-metoxy-1,4-benzoquinol methylase
MKSDGKLYTSAVLSPITGTSNVILEGAIDSKILSKGYQENFQFNINYILKDVDHIQIYKCLDTGYRFYYPLHISGDDKFYKHFSNYSWYYLKWKWEHEQALKFIKDGDNILEVGSGSGNFLKHLKNHKKVECTGLELNSQAVLGGKAEGVNLLNESVEDHSKYNSGKYDFVCSFQVLEHIPNAGEVIKAMIDCLKVGGTLLISVPNNDSYIKDNPFEGKFLNMPPHHMGLWNEKSLKSICDFFPLIYRETIIEPIQPNHADTYQYTKVQRILFNSSRPVRIYWKLRIYRLVRPILLAFSKFTIGHTIICVYTKK